MQKYLNKKTISKFCLYIAFFFFGSTILTTIAYAFLPVPYTPFMFFRSIQNKKFSIEKQWVPLEEISDDLVLAVIASEDQLFLQHLGFDIQAIKNAVANNQRKGKSIKGGSTISQQTAKNVFLSPSRSWLRKGFEVYFTSLIELLWSKKRIIEVYLNVIEMGDGIYGAQAAAQGYFSKDASKLNRYEAAMIAAALPSPTRFSIDHPSNYMFERQTWILQQMNQLKPQKKIHRLMKKASK